MDSVPQQPSFSSRQVENLPSHLEMDESRLQPATCEVLLRLPRQRASKVVWRRKSSRPIQPVSPTSRRTGGLPL